MIRVATTADCEELAAVHVRSWQQAYVGMVPQWYLDSLDPLKRAESWRRIIRQEATTVLLDFADNELVGFAGVGPCRDQDAASDWGEVGALYYLEPYWGSGRSWHLLSGALERLRSSGFRAITLWVLHENTRAISFYQKFGFRFDGTEKVDERMGFALNEVRMCA